MVRGCITTVLRLHLVLFQIQIDQNRFSELPLKYIGLLILVM